MTIALGVVTSAGFIHLISVALLHFYDALCFRNRKKSCNAIITVQISADVEIPAIGEDVHLFCDFMPSNKNAEIFIVKDNFTSLANKICFKDGDCENIVSTDLNDANQITWMTDNTSANLTISKWGMSDNGDYRCTVDGITSHTVKLDVLLPGPPDAPEIDGINDLRDGKEAAVNCTSNNGYPAPLIHWFMQSTNLTKNSSLHATINRKGRVKAISTLVFTPSRFHHGKRLICEVFQPTAPYTISQNDTKVLNILFVPDPPSRFFVDQNQTTSSTIFVAWQPGFDGGFQQTFTLQYCPNDTQGEGCGIFTNLTGASYTLVGLQPFTWYRMTVWAVNSAGSSSAVEVLASTAPLPPDSYGVIVTLDRENHVLTFSMANQSLEGICFIIIPKTKEGNDCSFVNETECIAARANVSIDSEDDLIVVTYGRALCSNPADIVDLQEEKKPPSRAKSPPFMTITIGVTSSVVFLFLISVALMYFYGALCFRNRKKSRSAKKSTTNPTVPPVATTKLQSQQVSQEVYAEISSTGEHKSESPKSTKGFYMDMKPILFSQSTISGFKPSGGSTDDYVSPSPRKEQEPEYASAEDPTYASAILRLAGDDDDGDDDDDDDGNGVETTCMYMEIDPNVQMESCSHGSKTSGPDIKGYFSPITKLRKNDDHVDRAEVVYTNTEYDKAHQEENREPQYANTVPITSEAGDATNTYMEINPEMASESCSNGSKRSRSDNKECLRPSFERMKNADHVDRAEGVYVNTENTCQKEPDDTHYINTVPMAPDDDGDDETAAYIEIKP